MCVYGLYILRMCVYGLYILHMGVYIYNIFLIHSCINGHLGWFHTWAIVTTAVEHGNTDISFTELFHFLWIFI